MIPRLLPVKEFAFSIQINFVITIEVTAVMLEMTWYWIWKVYIGFRVLLWVHLFVERKGNLRDSYIYLEFFFLIGSSYVYGSFWLFLWPCRLYKTLWWIIDFVVLRVYIELNAEPVFFGFFFCWQFGVDNPKTNCQFGSWGFRFNILCTSYEIAN